MSPSLPRREREAFEALCSITEGSAVAIGAAMPGPALSGSAVRTLLTRLEAKGLVERRTEGQTNIYRPSRQPAEVAAGALQRLVQTFFNGSAANAATALLGLSPSLKPDELEALQRAIDEAKDRQTEESSQ